MIIFKANTWISGGLACNKQVTFRDDYVLRGVCSVLRYLGKNIFEEFTPIFVDEESDNEDSSCLRNASACVQGGSNMTGTDCV